MKILNRILKYAKIIKGLTYLELWVPTSVGLVRLLAANNIRKFF